MYPLQLTMNEVQKGMREVPFTLIVCFANACNNLAELLVKQEMDRGIADTRQIEADALLDSM